VNGSRYHQIGDAAASPGAEGERAALADDFAGARRLVLETPKAELEAAIALMRESMEKAFPLQVPSRSM
jgi:hypothetical protein